VLETWFGKIGGTVAKLPIQATSQVYGAPGYLVYMQGDSLLAQAFDAKRGTVEGEPHTLVSGVGRNESTDFGLFSVSANGTLVYRPGLVANPSRLTWFDRTGKATGTVGDVADYSNPALSRDGGRLAVAIRDTAGKRDIWVIDLEHGLKTRITFDPADETNPTWSADGSELAYSSDRTGHRELYIKSASGTGTEQVLGETDVDKTLLDWTADGKMMIYSIQSVVTKRDLWTVRLGNGPPLSTLFLGTPFNENGAEISPDGRWAAYTSDESGSPELYVQPMPPNGHKWRISNAGAQDFRWRPDSRELFYIVNNAMHSVEVQADAASFAHSEPKILFTLPTLRSVNRNRFVVSHDGTRFLVITPEEKREADNTAFKAILNWPSLLGAR
jgi:dipeptidyl aminopeptidase/acylaminoacyl peptidase